MDDRAYVDRRSLSQRPVFGGKGPLLGHLDIELTERCNNVCLHCYINLPAQSQSAARRELTTGQWKDVLRQAADLGALSVRFTGGEPLLRTDFVELYLFARRLGMKVVLFTNGRLITPELAGLLDRTPPLRPVEVSVYGMRPESYGGVAGVPGAFGEFRRGIELLLERHVPFVVKSVLLPPNRAEREEFESWAATIPGMKAQPAYAVFLDLRTRRDSPTKNRRIAGLRYCPEEGAALVATPWISYRHGMAEFSARFMYPQGDRLFCCGAGHTGCVDAYGVIQMCILLRHPQTVYDLRSGSIGKALTDFFPQVRELRASNPEYLRRCARCFLKGLCEQCPAKSWSEHGTLDTPVEYLCQVAHAQARHLGLVSTGEWAWEVSNWRQRLDSLAKREGITGHDRPPAPVLPTC